MRFTRNHSSRVIFKYSYACLPDESAHHERRRGDLFQQRNPVCLRRRRERSQEGINVSQLRIGHHLGGERRHLIRRTPDVSREGGKRDRPWTKARARGGRALRLVPVTLVATDRGKE